MFASIRPLRACLKAENRMLFMARDAYLHDCELLVASDGVLSATEKRS